MITEQIPIAAIMTVIFQYCDVKKTGTLFISTDDNKSCQIVLKNGSIEFASLGQSKGNKALSHLKKTQYGKFSFKKDLILPMLGDAKISSSDEALRYLGYIPEKTISHSNRSLETIKKPTVTYRGQVIEQIETAAVKSESPKPEANNKPVRIYRGQVIS